MRRKKVLIIFMACCLFLEVKTVFAQRDIQVLGSEFPDQVKQYAQECLTLLKVNQKVKINIFISETLTYPYEGLTTQHPNDSIGVSQFSVHLISGMNEEKQLLVLAHELIHVKQYLSKKLELRGVDVYWQGRKFHLNHNDLHHTPWENEAYAADNMLTRKFAIARKKAKKIMQEMMAKK